MENDLELKELLKQRSNVLSDIIALESKVKVRDIENVNIHYGEWSKLDGAVMKLYHKYRGCVIADVICRNNRLQFRKHYATSNKKNKDKYKNEYLFLDEKLETRIPETWGDDLFMPYRVETEYMHPKGYYDERKLLYKKKISTNAAIGDLLKNKYGILCNTFQNGGSIDLVYREFEIVEDVLRVWYSHPKSSGRTRRFLCLDLNKLLT